ncbi:MAG TPA: cobalamin-independent methionine synthase II family protein [Solirubrobacteraceae bacterium]|jgi:5-methyltetrahydropteroyltriglutamate--homocysteine methyltransferase|nr:cobalamin-independent methionine synthase II family protein [Solirubrobacteraceae bacterium]
MFTATADLILPTTTTGSWPRPAWYTETLHGRSISKAMQDMPFREQFTDALSAMLDEQERAGLDILTHGDYFHDTYVGGQGWISYVLERWKGLEGDHQKLYEELPAFGPGEILNEVWSAWRWPQVTGKVEPDPETPLEYAKIWRLAQARTSKPVMFGTVSSQQFPMFLDINGAPYDDDDREQMIWDMAVAMNEELRALAAAGCKVIQIEEPLLHFVSSYHAENTRLLDVLVDAFNREVEGLDGVEVWVHTCWGSANMQRGIDRAGTYANCVELYLERINADVWTIETDGHVEEIAELLKPYKGSMKRKVALGVVSHRTLQVETAEEVAATVRTALDAVEPDKLVLTSDCGFGRGGAGRLIALYKSAATARGANIVRRELGVEQRPVPIENPQLQADNFVTSESELFGGLVGH